MVIIILVLLVVPLRPVPNHPHNDPIPSIPFVPPISYGIRRTAFLLLCMIPTTAIQYNTIQSNPNQPVLLVSVEPFRYHASADTTTAAVQLQSCGNNKTSSTTIIHRCVRYQHIRNRHRNTNIQRTSIACIGGTLPVPCQSN